MALFEKIITILNIRNIGNQPLSVGVAPADEEFLLGTDLTPFDGSDYFDGEGLVKIMPGRHFEIEEYRVNLGQIQNYIDGRQATVLFLDRLFTFTDGTDVTG
jgi:hypothetical protein